MKQTGTVGFTGIEITVITLACIGVIKVAQVGWDLSKLAYRSYRARKAMGKTVRDMAADEVAAMKVRLTTLAHKQAAEQVATEQVPAPAQA